MDSSNSPWRPGWLFCYHADADADAALTLFLGYGLHMQEVALSPHPKLLSWAVRSSAAPPSLGLAGLKSTKKRGAKQVVEHKTHNKHLSHLILGH
jgi:hypothetical protein